MNIILFGFWIIYKHTHTQTQTHTKNDVVCVVKHVLAGQDTPLTLVTHTY
jgi:hypothetical protein